MSKQRVVIITSNQLRHMWLIGKLTEVCEVVGVVKESKPENNPASINNVDPQINAYFNKRTESELFWFGSVDSLNISAEKIYDVNWGGSNTVEAYQFIDNLSPDLIILFGSSIIREPLLTTYSGRIINMHLGLSPYYRGSATNFWPLVDKKPECVGVTIHHATLKVDGGAILMQARPDASVDDNSHDLGCKSIIAGFNCLSHIIAHSLYHEQGVSQTENGKLCRRDGFAYKYLQQMQMNFKQGMMDEYLRDKQQRDSNYPIVE